MAENKPKFDAQSAITQTVQLAVGFVASSQQAKKQRELQEKLAKLTLEQQEDLAIRLQDAQTEIARVNIMYQTFAVLENDKLVNERKNKQLTLFYFLGGGSMLLIAMAIIYKMRK